MTADGGASMAKSFAAISTPIRARPPVCDVEVPVRVNMAHNVLDARPQLQPCVEPQAALVLRADVAQNRTPPRVGAVLAHPPHMGGVLLERKAAILYILQKQKTGFRIAHRESWKGMRV